MFPSSPLICNASIELHLLRSNSRNISVGSAETADLQHWSTTITCTFQFLFLKRPADEYSAPKLCTVQQSMLVRLAIEFREPRS